MAVAVAAPQWASLGPDTQHFYWQIGGFQIHAQVLITSWVVITILLGSVIIAVRNPQTIPTDGQNFFEYVLEFIRDLSKTQIGEEYGSTY
jgi:F-type H+-transporting ATPase subunit a